MIDIRRGGEDRAGSNGTRGAKQSGDWPESGRLRWEQWLCVNCSASKSQAATTMRIPWATPAMSRLSHPPLSTAPPLAVELHVSNSTRIRWHSLIRQGVGAVIACVHRHSTAQCVRVLPRRFEWIASAAAADGERATVPSRSRKRQRTRPATDNAGDRQIECSVERRGVRGGGRFGPRDLPFSNIAHAAAVGFAGASGSQNAVVL